MMRKMLAIGVAAAALLVGGWALAQSGPGGYGPGYGRGDYGCDGFGGGYGPGGMYGMQGRMGGGMYGGPGMHRGWGPGRQGGWGPGMQGGGAPGMGGWGLGPRAGFGAGPLDAGRIDALKTELAITAAQEPAWTKYTDAVKTAATALQSARDSVDTEAVGRMTPTERFTLMTRLRSERHKQIDAVHAAAAELLATLDETQKAKAFDRLPGLAFGPGMRGAGFGPRWQNYQ
jgi:hypothetical protein